MEKCLKVETDVTDADRINTQIEFVSQEKESSTSHPCKIYVFVRKNTPLNEFLSQKIDKYVYDNYRYPAYPSSFILKEKDLNSKIYSKFYLPMNNDYKNNTSNERVVIDYIAGMTDEYFLNEYKHYELR